ncbi:hypothetical protein ACA910_022156 [Epithemia clementina (nom. ined.)]
MNTPVTATATAANNNIEKEDLASYPSFPSYPVEQGHQQPLPAESQTPHHHSNHPQVFYPAYDPSVLPPHHQEQFPMFDSYDMEHVNSYHVSHAPPPQGAEQHQLQGWIAHRLKGQVEFYFSYENLVRDDYMVQQLLVHGGNAVPCMLVGSFPRVRDILGGGIASPQLLQEALRFSPIVRVYGAVLVPLTDALHQALYVRRQPASLQHQQQMPHKLDLASASRYSPTTTSITDDTTASSQATTPKETPVALQPPDDSYRLESQLNNNTMVMTPSQAPSYASVAHWPVESPQPQYAYIYSSNQPHVVPYGYTVTTPSVTPDAASELVSSNYHQGQQQHHSQRRNHYNKKKGHYNRHKKRFPRQDQNHHKQNEHNRNIDGSPKHVQAPDEDKSGEDQKLQDDHVHDQHEAGQIKQQKNYRHDKQQRPQYTAKDAQNGHSQPHNQKQSRKQRNQGKWQLRGGKPSSSSSASWTNDDFPSLHTNNNILNHNESEQLLAGLQGLSLQQGGNL